MDEDGRHDASIAASGAGRQARANEAPRLDRGRNPKFAYGVSARAPITPLIPLIIDAHEDIAFNVLCAGRDYHRSVAETRAREEGSADLRQHVGIATLGLREWRAGRVGVIFATIFVEPSRSRFSNGFCDRYDNAEQAYTIARRQLAVYESLTQPGECFRLIRTRHDFEAVIAAWGAGPAPAATEAAVTPPLVAGDGPPIGLVLLMENADAIRDPAEVEAWYEAGLRVIGPAWMASRYCGGTFEPGPLTALGCELLDRMADRGMVLDTSHMAEEAFFEAVERYPGPIIASHSNPRHFVDADRHLSDEMIRALIARDGVMGHVPFNAFLVPGWSRRGGSAREAADLSTVVAAIDHVCHLAGNARHVAFGSDLDGGFGAEATPVGIDSVADLQAVAEALAQRGYSDTDVAAIAHGNWTRILRRGLPE